MTTRLLLALALLVGVLAPLGGTAQAAPEPEIIGGRLADPGEYPFQVAILQRNVTDRARAQYCAGSLITSQTVLTAAHCVRGTRADRIDVLAGTHRLAPGGGQRIHVQSKRVHPGYNPRTSGNDLAVLHLASPVSVPHETLPLIDAGRFDLWDPGTVATVIGWGDRARRADIVNLPVNLWEVEVPLLNVRQCRQAYGRAFITKKMLCAGDLRNGGEDACQGDSGGPLFVPDGADWVQVGIVSWGIGCGRRRYPGVYTRLVRYRPWLNQFLN